MRQYLKAICVIAIVTGAFLFAGCGGGGGGENPLSGIISGSTIVGKLEGTSNSLGLPVFLMTDDTDIAASVFTERASIRNNSLSCLAGPIQTTVSDPYGNFEFNDVAPGKYNVLAQSGDTHSAIAQSVVVGVGAAVVEVNVKLEPTGQISGTITVPDGYQMDLVTVFIKGTGYAAHPDDSGAFTIRGVPAGTFSLVCSAPGLQSGTVSAVTVQPAVTTPLDMITLDENIEFFAQGPVGPQGEPGIQGPQGEPGADGVSIFWLGSHDLATDTLPLFTPVEQRNYAYYNTRDKTAYIYDGAAWQVLAESGKDGQDGTPGKDGVNGAPGQNGADGKTMVWLGESGSIPTEPASRESNDIYAYYNSTDGKSYVWTGGAGTWTDNANWSILAQDGVNGIDGIGGTNGIDGLGIVWLGEAAAHPAGAVENNAYRNTLDGASYIYTKADPLDPASALEWKIMLLPAAPRMPVNLSGSWSYGATYDVSLSWDQEEEATSYRVYRTEGAGAPTLIAIVNAGTYTDTDLVYGTTYQYHLEALREGYTGLWMFVSDPSQTIAVTIELGSPQNLSATIAGQDVSLMWDPVSSAQTYNLYWTNDPDIAPTLLETGVSSPYATVNPHLGAGKYAVTAVNGSDESNQSEVPVTFGFAGGTGKSDNPYEVALPEHLDNIRNFADTTGICFIQTDNIDLSGYANWVPIPNAASTFNGSFNGNGYTIANLTINSTESYVGLFGLVQSTAALSNIRLDAISVQGDASNVGALAGHNVGSIVNCHASNGTVTSLSNIAGGLAGSNAGAIDGSSAAVEVDGIAAGGLVGDNEGSVTNSKGSGNVTSSSVSGGLVATSDGNIDDCLCDAGTIESTTTVGGLVGYADINSVITGSFSSAEVIGGSYTGGLVGVNAGQISTCHCNAPQVKGDFETGGLVGENITNAQIDNSYSTATVFGPMGGKTGGLVGLNDGSTVIRSHSRGNVEATGGSMGGLVAYNSGSGTITECYCNAQMLRNEVGAAGGLVGVNEDSLIQYCYSTAEVVLSSEGQIGGLVGENFSGAVRIEDCYSAGIVYAPTASNVGGLVGSDSGNTINSYWDAQTSTQAVAGSGSPLQTGAMKTESSFDDGTNVWDFTNTWRIFDGVSYPYLKNNPQKPAPTPRDPYPDDLLTPIVP